MRNQSNFESALIALAERREQFPDPSVRIRLGNGPEVSPYCLGLTRDPDVVEAAFESGVNFFFCTVDMHWPRYAALREGLRRLCRARRREDIVVAACTYLTQPEFLRLPFQELLEEVPELRSLDVLIMGGCRENNYAQRLPAFESHRSQSFVGCTAIGASFHDRALIAPALSSGEVDIAFGRYNPGHPGALLDVFPSYEHGVQRPLFNFNSTRVRLKEVALEGWRPSIADCYRFALSRPAISGLLCAPQTLEELDAFYEAVQSGPLTYDQEVLMLSMAAGLKELGLV